jgi:hypothetical protein
MSNTEENAAHSNLFCREKKNYRALWRLGVNVSGARNTERYGI